jgi:hypothetical protein
MSRGNKGKTLNLKGSHLSAAPPFWENETPLSHDCDPILFSSTTFSRGAPDFLFLLTLKPSPETSPLTSKRTLLLGQREKTNLSSSQRRADPHYGSGHLPIGRSNSQPNRPAPFEQPPAAAATRQRHQTGSPWSCTGHLKQKKRKRKN